MGRIKYTFNPYGLTGKRPPKNATTRRSQLNRVKEFVLNEVLGHMDAETSIVDGSRWQKLSKDYAEFKGTDRADLELSGDLKSAIRIQREGDTNNLTLRVLDSQDGKADGHCNFSGRSKLPLRRFVPKKSDGETFSSDVLEAIRSILEGDE